MYNTNINAIQFFEYEYKKQTTMTPVEQQQEYLIASIRQEIEGAYKYFNPSSFRHSVWFQPSSGRFLYDDRYRRYEVIEPLIENKTLVFKGIEKHQGEKMLRYTLTQKTKQV